MDRKRILKITGGVVLSLVVLVALGFLTGVLGLPGVTVTDVGDWGNVSENETEVITSLNVSNPNPIGITLGGGFEANYSVDLNDVTLITGQRERLAITPGTTQVDLVSTIDNQQIVPWWRAYVAANETVHVRATGQANVSAVVSKTIKFPPYEQTVLEDRQPVINGFDGAATAMEGTYTRSVAVGTVGYEIRNASAAWGETTPNVTEVDMAFQMHNPGDVPVPLVPDGFRLNAETNGIELFTAGEDAMTAENADSDALLAPGETREVVLTVNFDNRRIDDWFRSHVERDERTELSVRPQMIFEVEQTGSEIAVPREGVRYSCEFQTAMLVDDQQTETTCGEGGGMET